MITTISLAANPNLDEKSKEKAHNSFQNEVNSLIATQKMKADLNFELKYLDRKNKILPNIISLEKAKGFCLPHATQANYFQCSIYSKMKCENILKIANVIHPAAIEQCESIMNAIQAPDDPATNKQILQIETKLKELSKNNQATLNITQANQRSLSNIILDCNAYIGVKKNSSILALEPLPDSNDGHILNEKSIQGINF